MYLRLSQIEYEDIQSKELSSIKDSKAFRRLKDKTQVLVPSHEYDESVMNRQSHSFAVAESANQMSISIAKSLNLSSKYQIDYTHSLDQASLLHDIGHPPFGHDGAKIIDTACKARGLDEGFDDNNNNLTVIETNNMKLRDCVLAHIIKYPHKLYGSQEKYVQILKDAIKDDKKHFRDIGIILKNQTRTINCQIMDEADRNTYTCDDMRDYFSLNEGRVYSIHDVLKLKSADINNQGQLELINEMLEVVNPKTLPNGEIKNPSKTEIANFFNKVKGIQNNNWKITDNGLEPVNMGVHSFRELLSDMTMEFYIKPIRAADNHKEDVAKLNIFINKVFSGEYEDSKHYTKKMNSAENNFDFLRACRDAAAEVSDHYIKNSFNKILEAKEKVSERLKRTY